MSELELKFHLPDGVQQVLRDALLLHGAQPLRLQAHYFDTADGRLAQQRIALRLRLEGDVWMQTLKAAGAGLAHRLEHEVVVAGGLDSADGTVPALDIHRHDGSDAGRALALALHGAPGPLAARHGTHVSRLHCLLRDENGTVVEAALDTGTATAGSRSADIAELELEHKGGPLLGLFDLARAWVLHGGLWLSTLSKAARGERLCSGLGPQAVHAAVPRFAAQPDGRALVQALLQSALEQVIGNAGEVADGAGTVEVVHQLRVGLRRLRTVLRELAPLVAAAAPADTGSPARRSAAEWEPVLATVFGQLGQLRDADAAADTVRPLLAAAGAPLLAWRAGQAPDPVAAVRDTAFQSTLVEILALAHAGPDAFAPVSPAQAHAFVARRLRRLHRRLVDDARCFAELPLPDQHKARKRLKRLRYLADMTAALWPARRLKRYLAPLSSAQEALGLHNDVAVAAGAFRDDAAHRAEAWFAAGYLQSHLAVTAAAAQAALRKAAAAEPFWRDR